MTKAWSELRLGEEALGGLSAGIIGTVIGFPLDTVKTRMQTMRLSTSPSAPSPSIIGVGTSIVRTEGVLAIYRGIAPPLLSLSILNIYTFTAYSFVRERYGARAGWDWRNAAAGTTCSLAAGFVSTVENLVKTQMQLDNITKKQFRSSFHCAQSLIQAHGWRVVYTGHAVNTLREATFIGNYFGVYEGLRYTFIQGKVFSGDHPHSAKLAVPIAGGLAGAWSWFISFPLDCVRAGVQGQSLNTFPNRKSAVQVFRELMKEKGVRGLYSGASASILRAFLVSGSRFSAYEGALWLLRGGRNID